MAFPIPSHLPRKQSIHDVSSQILNKVDATTIESFNSALTASWLVELERAIQSTKERIHERVQRDLPTFERQLAASKSIQTRLQSLTASVDVLNESVSDPKVGLVPTLIENLTRHAELAQESMDASVMYDALSHLVRCKTAFQSLELLIKAGKLPDAVEACQNLELLLQQTPAYLNETNVLEDIRSKFRAARARNEEQLSDAYTRSIIISHNELTVFPSVQVRQSETILSLSSVLSSLSQPSLSNHLTILRRDLTAHFIDHILKQPTCIMTTSSGFTEHKLSHVPSPPNEEIRITRLENLSNIFRFLSSHFFPSLPYPQRTLFTRSLCKPTTTSLLNNLLIPSLPSSLDLLPPFVELVKQSVAFEDEFIIEMLGNDANDRPVKVWADGLSGHYERQRRLLILDHSRSIVMSPEDPTDIFMAEIEVAPEIKSTIIAQDNSPTEVNESAWGFDDDTGSGSSAAVEDGWGFDDDVTLESGTEHPESQPTPEPEPGEPSPSPEMINVEEDPDPSEAWGWNDDDEVPPAEETAWDDPWADEPPISDPPTDPHPPISTRSASSPKIATRLEKAANKGKKHVNGSSSAAVSPQLTVPPPSIPQTSASHTQITSGPPTLEKRPSNIKVNNPKESFSVSGRVKRVIGLLEDALNEGKRFTSSKLFPPSESGSAPGSIILLSAPSVLDLYRALYPVKFASNLTFPEHGMRYSNDCSYLGDEVERIHRSLSVDVELVVKERLLECKHHFKILSDSWYHNVIEQQQQIIDNILLSKAQGFTDTGDQDRYDECEAAISQALQEIRRIAQKLKGVLSKSKYYTAIGMMTDAALSRILRDILTLPDIPEVESHRLSELCRIFNAIEGLFAEDPSQPTFVVAYVPLWLKFSYLSELLEASMADIAYLFEQGALVDFEVDELVRLVRALFADTPLRTSNINKLLSGHPIPSQ